MKMKRSEKLGMFTGLVVGVLLLLISVFMIFQTTCKVWGAEKPANATQQGIDVSSHQGKIDWEQVKNSALADYAIIRCGYGVIKQIKMISIGTTIPVNVRDWGSLMELTCILELIQQRKQKAKQNMLSDFYRERI